MRALPILWISLGLGAVLERTIGLWAAILGFIAVWVLSYLAAAKSGRL